MLKINKQKKYLYIYIYTHECTMSHTPFYIYIRDADILIKRRKFAAR